MEDFLNQAYPWIKGLHIISIVTWFAAIFYLPRLFVYHSETENSACSDVFKVMERRLYKAIANPSVAVVFICGFLLLYINPEFLKHGWMHFKLLLVASLLVYHILCGRIIKTFAKDANVKSSKFYRIFNEYPSIVLVIVVFLTILKPW
jgi:putative membrane protein